MAATSGGKRHCPVCHSYFNLTKTEALNGRPAHHPELSPWLLHNHEGDRRDRVCANCVRNILYNRLEFRDLRDGGRTYSFVQHKSAVVRARPLGGGRPLDTASRMVGMHAGEELPEGLPFPYDGLLLDETDTADLKSHSFELSKLYAHAGPQKGGVKYMIYGQFAKHSTIASYINCGLNVAHKLVNCAWGRVRVTAEMIENYTSMQRAGMKINDEWPCIRTTRTIALGEELIVAGYGSSFWGRVDKEAQWSNEELKLYRHPFIDTRLDAWLKKRHVMVENYERACSKRPREEPSQPSERKKRRPNNGR